MARRIISRARAKEKGLKFYFTGRSCLRGHVVNRYSGDGTCTECKRAQLRTLSPAQKRYYLEYQRKYYGRNREHLKARQRAKTAKGTAWHQLNKERSAMLSAEWKRRNHATVKKITRAWYLRNIDQVIIKKRAWRKSHPEEVRAQKYARLVATGRHTGAQSRAILIRQNYRCANPRCRADLRIVARHLDHKNPISRGGTNWPRNLQWLCAACNLSKGAATMREWLKVSGLHRHAH